MCRCIFSVNLSIIFFLPRASDLDWFSYPTKFTIALIVTINHVGKVSRYCGRGAYLGIEFKRQLVSASPASCMRGKFQQLLKC